VFQITKLEDRVIDSPKKFLLYRKGSFSSNFSVYLIVINNGLANVKLYSVRSNLFQPFSTFVSELDFQCLFFLANGKVIFNIIKVYSKSC
jgi:hypothetical protein